MFYIYLSSTGLPVQTSYDYPEVEVWYNKEKNLAGWSTSRDFETYDEAGRMAAYLTAMTGKIFLHVDEGEHTSPRYRVIEAPAIGDKVSKSFNGDSYPCGEIVKITKAWQITTSTGKKFRRYKMTGGFRETGRGFWMISGHVDERNPHF